MHICHQASSKGLPEGHRWGFPYLKNSKNCTKNVNFFFHQMAWCQSIRLQKNYTWGCGVILKIGCSHLEPLKMGNSQILGLVKRTPGWCLIQSFLGSLLPAETSCKKSSIWLETELGCSHAVKSLVSYFSFTRNLCLIVTQRPAG